MTAWSNADESWRMRRCMATVFYHHGCCCKALLWTLSHGTQDSLALSLLRGWLDIIDLLEKDQDLLVQRAHVFLSVLFVTAGYRACPTSWYLNFRFVVWLFAIIWLG